MARRTSWRSRRSSPTDCRALIVERIRQSGPLTVAAFMDLALYAPGAGYYARAAQRSGRAGDFVTSVDIGPLFGDLLASWFCEMADALVTAGVPEAAAGPFHLAEAGAGNGRLMRDVLDACRRRRPDLYARTRATLVERSETARAGHGTALGEHGQLAVSGAELPARVTGIIFANELLDAMPVHVVVMTGGGLREVFVDHDGDRFVERLGAPSTGQLDVYFERAGITLEPGARADVNLAGLAWIRQAAAALDRGYLVIIDYGLEAPQLYASSHATGTLRTFHRHIADAPDRDDLRSPTWLVEPGTRDITSHVDLTSVRLEAEHAGLTTIITTDQSRFLLAAAERSGLLGELAAPGRQQERLALKALLLPEGMGTAFRVLVFGRHAPPLSVRQ